MTVRMRPRLHGTRVGAAPTRIDVDPGPDFINDPARGCHPGNAHLFFSDDRPDDTPDQRGASRREQNQARAICRDACPFTTECARYALDRGTRDGVWGGYVMSSVDERRRAARDLDWQPAPKPPTRDELAAQRGAANRATRQRTEQAVRAGREAGKSDGEIALQLGATPGHINNVRRQLGLPTVYGPGGRRIDHELAGA